tara:strand:+ start:150 stop:878 length:729 start_codon:yes stop_codon:yes gene_type:complete
MNYLVTIPARLKSTRLPNKPLIKIKGKEILLRTYERCIAAVKDSKKIIVATDHEKVYNFCIQNNIQVLMTSESCLTGTDRICEVVKKIPADIYINVQGDEPILDPNDLKKVISSASKDPDKIYNGYAEIKSQENYFSPNIPKVIFNPRTKFLMYMSRAAIPSNKTFDFVKAWKQVCIYAYPKNALKAFSSAKKTTLEEIEDIEILRFLELGYDVKMVELSGNGIAVDVQEDLKKVEAYLNEN